MMKRRMMIGILCAVMLICFTGCLFHAKEVEEIGTDDLDPAQTEQTPSQGAPDTADPANGEEETSSGDGKTVEEMIADKHRVDQEVEQDGTWYGKRKDVSAYLIIGVDTDGTAPSADSQTGGGQCDVLDLIVIDEASKQYTVLQINRDTITGVDITDWDGNVVASTEQQISFAHAYSNGSASSCENVARAVSRLLGGIDISGYVALRYSAVPAMNDAIGGVSVKIEDDFSLMDPTLVQGETVLLNGEQAIHFVRGRTNVGDGTNVSRMRRQRTYIAAFESKVRSEIRSNSAIINNLYNAASPYMVTNLSGGTVTTLANKAATYYNKGTLTMSGKYESVTYSTGATHTAFYPDAESLRNIVLQLFYTKAS